MRGGGAGAPLDHVVLRPARLVIMTLAMTLAAAVAHAQTGIQGAIEISAGLRIDSGTAFHDMAAQETSVGGKRALFLSRTRIDPSRAPDVKVGVKVTHAIMAEAAFSLGTPRLATRISDDVEGAADVTVREDVRRYLVEGGLIASLDRWRRHQWVPFAVAGVGYLRELHEGQTLLETGHLVYLGGGTRYLLPTAAGSHYSTGLRGDLRIAFVTGGVAIGDARQTRPVGEVSFFLRF